MAPPLTRRGEDEVTAPFTMTGEFHAQNGVSVNESFSGAGVAKLWLVHHSSRARLVCGASVVPLQTSERVNERVSVKAETSTNLELDRRLEIALVALPGVDERAALLALQTAQRRHRDGDIA